MDVEHTATSKGVESAAEAAEDVREDGNHPAVGVGLGFADAGGYGYDDDLTMAALDPMEIDALLLSVDGGIMSDTNTPCVPGANAATATSGITSPRQLEEGIIAETSTEIGHGRERRRNSPGSHSSARVGVSRTRRSRSAEEDLDSGGRRQGVAGTVAAGVMGALCLAGVVINSGVPVSLFVETRLGLRVHAWNILNSCWCLLAFHMRSCVEEGLLLCVGVDSLCPFCRCILCFSGERELKRIK